MQYSNQKLDWTHAIEPVDNPMQPTTVLEVLAHLRTDTDASKEAMCKMFQNLAVACNQNLDQVRSTLNRVCCEKEQQIPINHAAACDNAWFIYHALNAGVSLRHVNCNGMFVVVFLEVHSFFMM